MLRFARETTRFRDRREAGRALAERLHSYAERDDVIVLGLPRGGVPVAYEVANALGVPLDVFVVRKLGVPGFEELAMGAIASGGIRVVNESVLAQLSNPAAALARATDAEAREVERREARYRGKDRPPLRLQGKTVVLVDDGLATGATMRAAAQAVKRLGAARRVVAVPIAARDTRAEIAREVDEVVCLVIPPNFQAVGQGYVDFSQTSDAEVRDLLARAAAGAQ